MKFILAALAGLVPVGFALNFTMRQMADGPETTVRAEAAPQAAETFVAAIVPSPPKVVTPPEVPATQEVPAPSEAEQVALAPAAVIEEAPAADPEPVAATDLPVAPVEEPPATKAGVASAEAVEPAPEEAIEETSSDYFQQLAAAYATGEAQLIEIKGPEGTFTVRIERGGYRVSLVTPGGNTIRLHTYNKSRRPLYDVVESQGQTLFGISGNGYKPYDPLLDELGETVTWKEVSWDPQRGFGHEDEIYDPGYPAAKVGSYYLFFSGADGSSNGPMISGPWTRFYKIMKMDLEKRRTTVCHYRGLATGALKEAVQTGDNLSLVFTYNDTRNLRVEFSRDTGFGEAIPVPTN